MMCGSPIVPSTIAISTDSVDSTGWPPPSGSSSGRDQPSPPGGSARRPRARPRPRGTSRSCPPRPGTGPGRAAAARRRSTTVVGSVTVSVVPRRNCTGVSCANRVNSTGSSAAARTVGSDRGDQPDRGPHEQHELQHELERLHVGGRPHPAERERDPDRRARDDDADPVRRAAHHGQHHARRLELGHQVQGGDHEDDHGRERAQAPRAQARLGEVGHGQRARPAHGRGHEREHRHVARREPDRVPQRPDPVLHHEPGDAEERRRRQVLPRHRRRVERRRDPPGRDEEVRRAAHRGDPAGADQQGDRDDEEDRGADHRGVFRRRAFDASARRSCTTAMATSAP